MGIKSEKGGLLLLFITQSCLTLCDPMDCSTQASLFFIISQSLLKLMSIESVMPSNHLILCGPLLLLPSIFLSIRVFSNESTLPSGGPSSGASASVLLMSIQDWFSLGLTGLISLQSRELPKVFSSTTVRKQQFFRSSATRYFCASQHPSAKTETRSWRKSIQWDYSGLNQYIPWHFISTGGADFKLTGSSTHGLCITQHSKGQREGAE